MTRRNQAQSLCLTILLAGLSFCPSEARADTTFDVSALVGNIQGGGGSSIATGLTLLGTLNIDTVGGTLDSGSLTLQGDAYNFTGFAGCLATCTFFNDVPSYGSFAEYGLLDLIGGLGTLVGYSGGPLVSDSYIVPGLLDPSDDAYDLTGTVTEESATPEPVSFGLVALGLGVLYAAARFRRA